MKHKKSESDPLKLVITAAILLVVLFVVVFGIIPIITGKQVPFIKGQTEQITQDCDEDNFIGLNDKCPCVKGKDTLENQKCGTPDSIAVKNCPTLCKK